jgi:hypothetical protein
MARIALPPAELAAAIVLQRQGTIVIVEACKLFSRRRVATTACAVLPAPGIVGIAQRSRVEDVLSRRQEASIVATVPYCGITEKRFAAPDASTQNFAVSSTEPTRMALQTLKKLGKSSDVEFCRQKMDTVRWHS